MSIRCKNLCSDIQNIEWKYVKKAWVPAITVCLQNLSTEACALSEICPSFTRSTYLWNACPSASLVLSDEVVTSWIDRIDGVEMFPISEGKEPGLTTSTNQGTTFNMLSFNGVSQGFVNSSEAFQDTEAFTVVVVVNNMETNLAENTGAIFTLINEPFSEQILLGWENGNIVVQNRSEGLIDIIDPIASDNGFHVIALRYSGIEGTGNVELFIDGGTASTNSSSFVFTQAVSALYIGSSLTDYALSGEIGWLAFYDSAISDQNLNTAISFAGNLYNINTTTIG